MLTFKVFITVSADIKLEEPHSPQPENGSTAKQKSTSEETSKAAQKYMQRVRKDAGAGLERTHVMVARSEEVESQRAKLPIYGEEQAIVEAISENTVLNYCNYRAILYYIVALFYHI